MINKNNILIKYTVIILTAIIISSVTLSVILTKQLQHHLIVTHIELYPSHISHITKDHSEIFNNFEKSLVINEVLSDFINEIKFTGNIIGINLIGKNGTIIWSEKKELTGKNLYHNDPQFIKAVAGQISYLLENQDKNDGNPDRIYGKLLKIYSPVIINDKISGVIELTESDTDLFLSIYDNNKFIWIFISVSGLILYVLLFQIFYNSYRSLKRINKQLDETQDVTIYALGYLAELRDRETGKHLDRTAKYVEIIAAELKNHQEYKDYITKNYIRDLVKAAPLHDIGKVAIPDSILLKPGKLTEEEFETIKKHCESGYMILKKAEMKLAFQSFLKIALQIVKYHHEKWNGTGYPDKLKEGNIPLSARIMAIADVYDALRTERPYKKGFSHENTIEIINSEKGKHFDPLIVDVFMKSHEKFKAISLEYSDD